MLGMRLLDAPQRGPDSYKHRGSSINPIAPHGILGWPLASSSCQARGEQVPLGRGLPQDQRGTVARPCWVTVSLFFSTGM